MEKCRLQQTYTSSQDEVILALQPLVRSGRMWKATEELEEVASDVRCVVVRGMIPPHPSIGQASDLESGGDLERSFRTGRGGVL